MVQELLERFPEACGAQGSAQLAAVQRFLSVNADLKRLRRSIGAGIAAYDPATATSPRGVFCVVRPDLQIERSWKKIQFLPCIH